MVDLPDKTTHFIDWYLEVVEAAHLTDKRYPVKGMNVWTPYGFRARRLLDALLIREIESSGSEPVEFPALIPANEFAKEGEHIKGFDAQVYWVTKGGRTDLEMPLVLRPTSETAIYPVFRSWIRSHRDLPLNVYQIVNTFRYETKTTRPFLRVREIHFFEEHTCQVDENKAGDRVKANLATFDAIARALALPYMALRRPEWDKFPGAFYTIGLDVPLGEARTLQIGTVHHYRENFSRPYGITYEDPQGVQRSVHQTTFGLSERLLGAVVGVHGDSRGVVFPSSIAPYQVVVVPIPGAAGGSSVASIASEIRDRLAAAGVRVLVDDADERPGAKYYRWELAGAPLRLEIGRREAEGRTATSVDRLGQKETVPLDTLEERIRIQLADLDRRLAERAATAFASAFTRATRLEELTDSPTARVIGWCGAEECGHTIETAINGALLGTPIHDPPGTQGSPDPCIACGRTDSSVWAIAARPL